MKHIEWWLMIILSIFLIAVYFLFLPAEAITRADVENTKGTINAIEKNSKVIDVNIATKKDLIIKQDEIITILKDTLRDVKRKAGDSWTAFEEIIKAEKNLQNGIDTLRSMKKDLISLLNVKSENTRKISQLEDQLYNDESLLKVKYDFSKMTRLVGIDISKSCEILIKNNITSPCVGYDVLKQMDTSNVIMSGDWITINNYTKRDVSPMVKSWKWYDNRDQIRIIVDPPSGMIERIKMITLTNNFDIYFQPKDFTLENSTRTWHEGRYVDDKCKRAVISVDNWEKWLPDTIHYMRTNCEVTWLDERKSEQMPFTEIDIRTSPAWQYQQWVINAKETCKVKC